MVEEASVRDRAIAPGRVGLILALLMPLAGCSAFSNPPNWAGGAPEGAPPRPAARAEYPAVHDLPPRRAVRPLTDDEQARLTQDLMSARDRNARTGGTAGR